jgi:hypothetical protein
MTTNNPMWPASLAIAAMWFAVLAVGLWGGDISNNSGAGNSTVPVVVIVAPCALIGTIVVARRAFGGPKDRP